MSAAPIVTWEELDACADYEICNEYPYDIRRRGSNRVIKESSNKEGYVMITLNGKKHYKHRVVAMQWIDNPDNLPCVDHKNRDKTDYHKENLRWVTKSDNDKNRKGSKGVMYEYVDERPQDAIEVTEYNGHKFEFLWFHDNVFYLYNGIQYRKLYKKLKAGIWTVRAYDTNDAQVTIYYTKFKKEYHLI